MTTTQVAITFLTTFSLAMVAFLITITCGHLHVAAQLRHAVSEFTLIDTVIPATESSDVVHHAVGLSVKLCGALGYRAVRGLHTFYHDHPGELHLRFAVPGEFQIPSDGHERICALAHAIAIAAIARRLETLR